MFCPHCGARISKNSKFCNQCSFPITQLTEKKETAPPEQTDSPISEPEELRGAPKPRKSALRLTLLIAIPLLIVAVGVTMLLAPWKNKGDDASANTIYLPTRQTVLSTSSRGYGSTTEYEWDYNDNGKLRSYSILNESDSYHYYTEYKYRYREDGQIESVEITDERDGSVVDSIELEYIYSKKGVLEDIRIKSDASLNTYVVECNDKGLITLISCYESGTLKERTEFEYHKNGNLKRRQISSNLGSSYQSESTTIFDENGRVIEQRAEDSYYSTVSFYSYDSEGRTIRQIQENTDTSNSYKIRTELTMAYGRTGRISKMSLTVTTDNGTVKASCDIEEVGNRTYITLGQVTGSETMLEEMGNTSGCLIHVYDDDGRLAETIIEDNGAVVQRQSITYMKFDAPKDYKEFSTHDPIWGLFVN